jgi:PAS domain S-box-containing protein
MNLQEFSEQIARMVERTRMLRDQASDEPEPSRVLYQALEELRTSLEELTVAEEELREKNIEVEQVNVELELERRRYRDLFMGAPLGYVVTDTAGVIREINIAANQMLGAEPNTLVGMPLQLFVAASDRDRWRDLVERARASGEPESDEVVHMRSVAQEGWFRCRAHVALERDTRGNVVAHRFILLDASTEELAREAERLTEEGRRKDEFLAMLAHELRNPLAPIRAAVELWRHHADSLTLEQSRWTVEVVSRQADHLAHLVDDLLDVSRVSHGKIRLRLNRVDLREVAEQARDALRAASQLHKLTFELPSDSVWVDGDTTRLRQVVVNLVDNAIKYTPKGRAIAVRVRGEGEDAVLEVGDEGVGLQPEQLETIFGLFTQGQSTLARSQGGLGLGLALVRRLVELHGGTVRAKSEGLGKGAVFIVRLPRMDGPIAATQTGEFRIPVVGARKILVVDDNVDAAEMLATLLEAEGHAPALAYDGASAMEMFESLRPEIVLLDLGLPDIDGLEVARHLRARSSDVMLVAVTGYGDDSMRARSRESGFDHHLLKPVDLDALRSLLLTRRKHAVHE